MLVDLEITACPHFKHGDKNEDKNIEAVKIEMGRKTHNLAAIFIRLDVALFE